MRSGFSRIGETVSVFVEAGAFHFRLLVPESTLRNPKGRAVVHAWLVGLVTLPGTAIPHREIEALLDAMDATFGRIEATPRTRFRLF